MGDGVSGMYARAFADRASAEHYDLSVYKAGGYSAFISHLQSRALPSVVRRLAGSAEIVHHDYACGTGRIISMFRSVVSEAHGYDVSESMLERAKQARVPAILHLLPVDTPQSPETPGKFILVTAFRFLLNTGDDQRREFLRFATQVLDGAAGVLIVDIHGNSSSLRSLSRLRRERKGSWFNSLSINDLQALLTEAGFVILNTRGFGILPEIFYRKRPVAAIARRVDAWVARTGWLSRFSIDVVVVAEHQSRKAGKR